QPLRRAYGVRGAEIRGLENRAHHAFCRGGITPDEVAVADEHAAEVLRPRAIHGALQHDASDLLGVQFLEVWRKAQERIDLPVDEKLLLSARSVDNPAYIFARVEPYLRGHQSNEHVRGRSEARYPDPFPLEV